MLIISLFLQRLRVIIKALRWGTMAPILNFKCPPDKRLDVITNEVVFDAWYFISLIIHQSFATRETHYLLFVWASVEMACSNMLF